jgi:uncharacterized repeat protein (TIGR01451 family)
MSTSFMNFGSLIFGGLTFSDIDVSEVDVGNTVSFLGSASSPIGLLQLGPTGLVVGMSWQNFDSLITGAGSSETLTFTYDVSASSGNVISAMNAIYLVDEFVGAGDHVTAVESAYDPNGNLLGTQTYAYGQPTSAPVTLINPQQNISVTMTLTESIDSTGTPLSAVNMSGIEATFQQAAAPPATASIGDIVFLDLTDSGLESGVNSGPGMPGVTVELLDGTGTSVLATTTTNSIGAYSFTGLTAGTYEVEFIAPSGYTFSPQDVGGSADAAINSSPDQTTGITAPITLTAGQVDNNVEAGLVPPGSADLGTASLGDYVWFDSNDNGLQDSSETGVSGVTVDLLDSTGTTTLATTTTNSSGLYSFTNLTAGTYEVEFVAPTGDAFTTAGAGTNPAIDSSANQTTGITAPITLTSGQVDDNVDAGLTGTAALGDYVWFDTNGNGLIDSTETGVGGVTVDLLNAAGTSTLAVTTTNNSGYYSFTNLAAGSYEVQFIAPTGEAFTTQGVGTNPALDSSPNASTGVTAPVTLTVGQTDNNVEAGLVAPGVSILKSVTSVGGVAGDPAATAAGEAIDYNVVVTNTGSETLTNVVVSDTTLGTTLGTLASLAAGASVTLTAVQTVTQAEINSGAPVSNTATVSDTQGVTGTSTASTDVTQTPAVSILKSVTSVGGTAGDPAATSAGQVIDYNVVVANTGNETLTNVVVADTTLGTTLGTIASLAPGASVTYTAAQTVTQAEINSGAPVANTATVGDTQNVTGTSTATTDVTQTPAVSIVKSVTSVGGTAGDPATTAAGQVIDYNVVVANTGNETLTNVVVADTALGTTLGTLASLAPGATVTYTAAQTVTQAEINSGGAVTNTATVGDTQNVTGTSTASTDVTQTPAVTIVKSVSSVGGVAGDPAANSAGEVIGYNIVVTNTGNETLTNVVVADTTLGTTLGTLASLAPGATVTYTAAQTVTQAEINAGAPVINTATVGDTQNVAGASTATTDVTQTPAVSIVKSVTSVNGVAGDPAASSAGQVIDYNVVVANTGNETLTNVVVADTTLGTTLGTLASLAPGATVTYTAAQTVTQAEINSGSAVTNTATVNDTQAVTGSSTASTNVTQTPAVSIVKSVTSVGGVAGDPAATSAGQVIDYNVVVSNTGNETLTNVVVADTTLGTTLGTLASLAPGASVTYTAAQTVTQAEINSGGVVANTATVADAQNVTGTSTASTNVTQTPAVSIVKSVASVGGVTGDPAATSAGQVIDYNVVVSNTGNETLTNVVVADTTLGTTLGTLASLAPGASVTYTAAQTVTQAEINSGAAVTNTATVGDTQNVTGTSTASTAVAQTPAVSIVKSVTSVGGVNGDPAATAAGQVIDYNVVVSNTGNETLTNVVVADTTLGTTLGTLASLAPGASVTYTAAQTVTQAEINSGGAVTNTATVGDTQNVTGTSTASTNVTQTPAVSIVKSVTSVGGVNGDPAATAAGQVIDYNVVVSNTGNETLTNVVVADTTLGTTLGTLASLAPGASVTYTAAQTVTQAEINAGSAVTNTATVGDTQNVTGTSTASTNVTQNAGVSIVKSVTSVAGVAGDPAATAAGQVIDYAIVVTDTGNQTLTNVVVTDTTLGITLGTLASLAPGASVTYTAAQTVTQAEINSGSAVTNTATVTDTQAVTGSSTASTNVTQTPGVSIVKSVTSVNGVAGDPAATAAGQVVDYNVVVSNTGNETLTNVVVADTTLGTTLGTLASLAPGASVTYTAAQTVTQAEINSGSAVTNTATVADTQNVTGTSTASTNVTQHPSVSIVKSVTSVGGTAGDPAATTAGQVIDYNVVVSNTGNETLTNVVVADTTLGTTLGTLASLAPGASVTYTAAQTVTQAEINSGAAVTNTATVGDTQNVTGTSTASTNVTQHPSVSIVKSVTSVGGTAGDPAATAAGEVVDYNVVVTNTGNETLTNVVVADTTLGTTLGTLASLAPGASVTYTAAQTVTQAEINSGSAVTNTATVNDTQAVTGSSTASTNVTQTPAVSIVKSVTSVGGTAGDPAATTAGQVIDYNVVVSNTGNETLTNVVVADTTLGTTLGTLASLAPGASVTYTAAQTVTQAEINSGAAVTNTATVGDSQNVTGSSTASTGVTQHPSVSIVKSVTSVGGVAGDPTATTAGEVIDYSVVVSNTGNETLTNVVVADTTLGTTLGTLASLAPGASITYTAAQTVTQAELNAGNPVTNTATVADTQNVTGSSTASTAVKQVGSVSIVKSVTSVGGVAGDPSATTAGEVINYNIVVTNTGTETLTNVVVTDTTLGKTLCTLASLAAGATVTYTASQTVTQAEINSGAAVTNTATVADTQNVTGTSTASTNVKQTPAVSIVKSVTSVNGVCGDPAATAAGQVIDYNVVVTNTGNETLTSVVVADTTLGTTLGTIASLAPGATVTYTAAQTVTQAEINSGSAVTNTATVNDAQAVTGTSTASTNVTQTPAVSIVKSVTSVGGVCGDPTATTAGEVIDYNVVVTNTGNETLTNVVVADTTLGTTLGTLASLAPGATVTYIAAQTVTQAELNSGNAVTNTATVTDTQTPTESSTASTAVLKPVAALGDYVWFDTNDNGLQDSGETGVAGVTVDLLNAAGTSTLAVTTTNSSGFYSFTNLTPGTYEVKFVAPAGDAFTIEGAGTNSSLDSNANPSTGITAPVTLTAGQTINTIDAGLVGTAEIGDYVWFDTNGNGLQDSSETGVAGVTVDLLNSTGTSVLEVTTTNSSGHYSFTGLAAGTYEVKFIAPSGDTFSPEGVGTNSAIDSNANQTTGITAPITLTVGQSNNTVDAGLESHPSISVLKLPCSVVVNSCGQVTYTFDVTNTGSTPLTNVTIKDNIGTAANPDYVTPTLVTTGTNGTLAAGATWVYSETVNQLGCQTGSGSVCHTASGSNLGSGCTAWLSSTFDPKSCANGATYVFQGVSCTISGRGVGATPITENCPNAVVTFSSSCTQATTTYNSSTNCWVTTLPANCNPGSVFLSGLPITVPQGCNLSGCSVTWSIGASSNNCGQTSVSWDGNCTGYSSFNQNGCNGLTDYNQIGVKVCDTSSGYGNGGSCNEGYGWNGSSYCDTGSGYGNQGYGCGGYNGCGWIGSDNDCAGTPENQYTQNNCNTGSYSQTCGGYNCGGTNGCGGDSSGYNYGCGGSGNNGSCGDGGTLNCSSPTQGISGAADTVTVAASTASGIIVTASDTKLVEVLSSTTNVSLNGSATTSSLSYQYGTSQTLEFTYNPGNTVSTTTTGIGAVTGTNSSSLAFIEISNNANPFASGASVYFEGSVTSGEKIFADATTNIFSNTAIAGGHFSTTAGADLYAFVFTSQAAFQAGSAPVQTMAYNTSGSQAMHFGDTIGSLSLIGYVGSNGGHLAS